MENKIWDLVLTEQLGNLRFGSPRKTVNEELGSPVRKFKKTAFSSNTTDEYAGFHVFYNDKDELEAVEIFDGITVLLNGKQIFPGTMANAKAIVPDIKFDSDGGISEKNSVGFCASSEDGHIESILIAGPHYYES